MTSFRVTHFIMLLLLATSAVAQNYGIRCQVTDTTGMGEPFATMRIFAVGDSATTVAIGVTDENGNYSETLARPGNYVLRVTSVGKTAERREFTINASAPQVTLPTIVLHDEPGELAGVTVTAQRQLIKNEIDRLSYDVQGDADSKTRTVLDMLRKVPLVSVDGQENINVRGSSNFKIYKNGHPDPAISQNPKEILKAIPATMIKRIEVITEPGAKYDAEGVSAILNIVTVDNSSINGVTGTVGAGLNEFGDTRANTYVTAQVGKFITSVNYGYTHAGKQATRSYSESENYYTATGNTLRELSKNTDSKVNVHYGNIESSFEPDTLNLLTLSFGGYFYNFVSNGIGESSMTDAAGNKLYGYSSANHMPKNSYYSFDGRFDYQHRTRVKDEMLTLSYLLSTSRSRNHIIYTYSDLFNMPVDYNGFDQNGKENFIEHTFQFDWTRPFASYHKFETGVKYIHRKNRSHTLLDYDGGSIADVDNRFNHLTQVAAAYAGYTFAKDRWSARAGLRYEFSYLSAKYPDGSQSNYHRSLNDWVPSASVNYQHDFANSLKLAFATRINRPGITYLNPTVISGPTEISYGNSHLSSARNYSLSLTYMRIGRRLTFNVSPNFSWSSNQIGDIKRVEDNVKVSTYDNGITTRSAGMSAFVQWQIHPVASLMFNGSASYEYQKNKSLGLKADGWNTFAWSQLTLNLPLDIRFTTNAGMWNGGISLYSHMKPAFFYMVGVQRSFLKENRLSVSIDAYRPFADKYICMKNVIDRGDYTGWNKTFATQRMVSLSVSYRFGSLKARVKKTDKTIDNNDMVGGSSAGGGTGQQGGGQQGGK